MRTKRANNASVGPSEKRVKLEIGTQIQSSTQVQAANELPFWADSLNQHAAMETAPLPAHSTNVSLAVWGEGSGKAGVCEDEESEDTASSSCASDSTADNLMQHMAVLDDGDSSPPGAAITAAAPFSFGHRPCIIPDVSHFETWDMVDSLLALAQC